jgi:uncharacterized protein (TIGR02594 family)
MLGPDDISEAPWMALARAELGVREAPGPANNARVVAYYADAGHPGVRSDATAWCAAFCGAVLKRAGYPNTGSLAARSYLQYGTRLDEPCPGCIVVFWRGSPAGWQGHVGFYVGEAPGGRVRVLGGNQSNAVTESSYPKSQLLGYRWPPAPDGNPDLDQYAIRNWQSRLAELGYPVGTADGLVGSRTRMAVRAYQETAGLEVTGALDADTLASLRDPDAPRMPVGEARANATAADVAAAGSGTIKAANKAEIAIAGGTAAATGNALTEATAALTEAGKVVGTVDTGRSLGTKAWDLVAWVATPRGAVVALSVIVCIGVWWGIRTIKARRVQAHREGRQV